MKPSYEELEQRLQELERERPGEDRFYSLTRLSPGGICQTDTGGDCISCQCCLVGNGRERFSVSGSQRLGESAPKGLGLVQELRLLGDFAAGKDTKYR